MSESSDLPLVTVLIPVYNAEQFLADAILSILKQSYKNLEILIINDGSTDTSDKIITSFKDSRIKYIKNEINIGLIKTLNKGLTLAKGKYIARMDADDISSQERIEKQVEYMEKYTSVTVCGTWFNFITNPRKIIRHPISNTDIRHHFLFTGCVLGHPTVIFRRDVIDGKSIKYDESYSHCEDYALWTALPTNSKFHNLPEVLLSYRTHEGQVSSIHNVTQTQNAMRVLAKILFKFLSNDKIVNLETAERFFLKLDLTDNEILNLSKFFKEILIKNYVSKSYPLLKLNSFLAFHWLNYFHQNYKPSRWVEKNFFSFFPIMILPKLLKKFLQLFHTSCLKLLKKFIPPQPSIVVKLSGDLGEQLFQFFWAWHWAELKKLPLFFDEVNLHHYKKIKVGLSTYLTSIKVASPDFIEAILDNHGFFYPYYRFVKKREKILRVTDMQPLRDTLKTPAYFEGYWDTPEHIKKYQHLNFRRILFGSENFIAKKTLAIVVSEKSYILSTDEKFPDWPLTINSKKLLNTLEVAKKTHPELNNCTIYCSRFLSIPEIESTLCNVVYKKFNPLSLNDLNEISQYQYLILDDTKFSFWVAALSDKNSSIWAPRKHASLYNALTNRIWRFYELT